MNKYRNYLSFGFNCELSFALEYMGIFKSTLFSWADVRGTDALIFGIEHPDLLLSGKVNHYASNMFFCELSNIGFHGKLKFSEAINNGIQDEKKIEDSLNETRSRLKHLAFKQNEAFLEGGVLVIIKYFADVFDEPYTIERSMQLVRAALSRKYKTNDFDLLYVTDCFVSELNDKNRNYIRKIENFSHRSHASEINKLEWKRILGEFKINSEIKIDTNLQKASKYWSKTEVYPPFDFDSKIYRENYNDLRNMSDLELLNHWNRHGKSEGRRPYELKDRNQFSGLISPSMHTLEIGPFDQPLIKGVNAKYCDVLDQNELQARASRMKNRKPSNVPYIHYVIGGAGLDEISDDFDAIISSHCIEHQPDLIKHLVSVQARLKVKSGRYFLLIPDKRFCFDRFLSESTCAQIIDAHESNRRVHNLQSLIEHSALLTHNDPKKHWDEPQLTRPKINPMNVMSAINTWKKSEGAYIDVHAWQFTPDSFIENIQILNSLGYINLKCERIYSTLRGNNEFWAILKSEY